MLAVSGVAQVLTEAFDPWAAEVNAVVAGIAQLCMVPDRVMTVCRAAEVLSIVASSVTPPCAATIAPAAMEQVAAAFAWPPVQEKPFAWDMVAMAAARLSLVLKDAFKPYGEVMIPQLVTAATAAIRCIIDDGSVEAAMRAEETAAWAAEGVLQESTLERNGTTVKVRALVCVCCQPAC